MGIAPKTTNNNLYAPCLSPSLLNYPNEILLIILEHVSSHDLFALATLCRKLNYIALPMYYQLHNVSFGSSTELILHGEGLNALPGLLISLSPKTFRRLSCSFPTDESALLASIRRLCAFVPQLTRLAEVVFEFHPIESVCYELELDPLSWYRPLEELMAKVGASGCSSLTIRGALTSESWLHSHNHQRLLPPPLPIASRLVSGLRRGYKTTKKACTSRRRGSRRVTVPETKSIAPIKDVATPSFRIVNISSAMFFFRILPRWTIQTLNSTPITKLNLSDISYYYPQDWCDVLASIHMPLLQDLTIRSCTIAFKTLSDLLNRHRRITTLTIDALFEHDVMDGWFPISKDTSAPSLTSLTAPVRYIPQFLTMTQIAPRLDTLTILAADIHGRRNLSEFAHVWWGVLDKVAERVKNSTLALDITLPYYSGFKHAVLENDTARDYLAVIKRLVVRPGACGEYLVRKHWARFREWLECFPALVELEIGDLEGAGVLTDEKERRAFVHELMPVFARVATVKLHDQNLW